MATRRVIYNGKRYVTASGCRFVVFGHARIPDGLTEYGTPKYRAGEPFIVRRSDNLDTAKKAREKAPFGVVVDYVGNAVYGRETGFRWEKAAA